MGAPTWRSSGPVKHPTQYHPSRRALGEPRPLAEGARALGRAARSASASAPRAGGTLGVVVLGALAALVTGCAGAVPTAKAERGSRVGLRAERARAAGASALAAKSLGPGLAGVTFGAARQASLDLDLDARAGAGDGELDAQPGATLAPTARCPAEMALVDGRFCVDRWEGTLVRRAGEKELAVSPFGPIDGLESSVRAVSKAGVVPQGYVSGKQAEQACQASGKRLCTTSEWVRACRGPRDLAFPYGGERRAGVCNDDGRRRHPVVEVGSLLGIDGDRLWRDGMNEPLLNQLEGTLARTGERSGCTNEWGVFDMVGNLHEWVDDADGTFRGGYFMDTSKNGDGCSYRTTAHDFKYHDYSTGFRCCSDADRVE